MAVRVVAGMHPHGGMPGSTGLIQDFSRLFQHSFSNMVCIAVIPRYIVGPLLSCKIVLHCKKAVEGIPSGDFSHITRTADVNPAISGICKGERRD